MSDAETGAETPPEPGIDFAALALPFDPKEVHWRIGSMDREGKRGIALAYIDARHVQERLDKVVGPENWWVSHRRVDNRNICALAIRVIHSDGTAEWISKEDGAGDTAIEGEKGGLSDALKRAAVHWGIGRYLYRLDSPWVAVENKRIADREYPRLAALLAGNAPPASPPAAPKAGATPPPASLPDQPPPPSEAMQLVSKCIRTAKQRRRHLGMVKPDESDGEEWAKAKDLCAYLSQEMGKAPGDDWTMERARMLESRVKLWDPTRGRGEDFGDDPPLNDKRRRALHAHAGDLVKDREAHDTVSEAAKRLDFESTKDVPDSRYGDMRRMIETVANEWSAHMDPEQQ